jgi:hypothetical protein
MKRIGGLFEQICDRNNLVKAAWSASREKRDRPEVRSFLDSLDTRLNQISQGLSNSNYPFQPYHSFEVRDTKSRTIRAPAFQDRVVHHAIIHVVGPVFERGAIDHSYACRTGRGQHKALRQAADWTRRTSWYGKIDIHKYYDSVDHQLLFDRLSRRFREKRLLNLFADLLSSWQSIPGKGLPIGALTSQYLGNFYLDAFDISMRSSGLCHRYVRYMDDIIIWSDEKQLPAIRSLAERSATELKLTIKHGGEWNRCQFGVPFLGFIIYPDRIRLGRQGRRRLRGKFATIRRQFDTGKLSEDDFQRRCTSLFAHAKFGDDVAWRRAVLSCSEPRSDLHIPVLRPRCME